MKEVIQNQEMLSYQDKIKIYKEQSKKEPFYSMACLAGQDTDDAWKLRNDFLKNLGKKNLTKDELDGLRGVSQGLAGIDSEEAWRRRKELVDIAPESTARGLAGMDSEEAWELRRYIEENYFDNSSVPQGLAESLSGLNNHRAWKLREKILKIYPSSVLEGLAGIDSEEAWNLREEYLDKEPLFVGASLIGLDNDRANKLREKLLIYTEEDDMGGAYRGTIVSLVGIDSDRAWEIREKYFENEPFGVGTSLAGIETSQKFNYISKIIEKIKIIEKGSNSDQNNKLLLKLRKGLLQGLHSNYGLEAVKMNKI